MFDKSPEKCKTAFVDNANAKCILYTDEDCKSDEDTETTPINIPNSYLSVGMVRNKIKGVSVRQGCTLRVWKGMNYFLVQIIVYRAFFDCLCLLKNK